MCGETAEWLYNKTIIRLQDDYNTITVRLQCDHDTKAEYTKTIDVTSCSIKTIRVLCLRILAVCEGTSECDYKKASDTKHKYEKKDNKDPHGQSVYLHSF